MIRTAPTWALLASVALADPLPIVRDADGVIVLQPSEKDSFTCTFPGRTLSAATSATAVLRATKQADASPTTIITNSSVSGSDFNFTIYPDQSCGSAGCRAGNWYEVILQPTDSNGNTPICNVAVQVRRKALTP